MKVPEVEWTAVIIAVSIVMIPIGMILARAQPPIENAADRESHKADILGVGPLVGWDVKKGSETVCTNPIIFQYARIIRCPAPEPFNNRQN